MKILVKCTLLVPVEVPDGAGYSPSFDIEENNCPGTGKVGAAIQKVKDHCDSHCFCWACNLQGKNEIVDWDYKGDA